ncbi:MAG: XdhC family protein [Myxococcota bacterium]
MEHEEVLSQAARWLQDGHRVALATVVKTWGSSPRPAGSHLVVRDDQQFLGSVSGGCVEKAVIEEAVQAMEDGQARLLEFGVSNEEAWAVGLACGGRIEVRVEPIQ